MLSITVDPAIVPNLARVFAVLACIGLSGFLIVYFAFGLRSPLAAAATAFPIGFAATLLVTNLLAYVLGTPRAFAWGLLTVLALALVSAIARRGSFRSVGPLSWTDCSLFVVAAITVFVLSVFNNAVYPVSDYNVHFWLANTIRFGNFPVMAPGSPDLYAEYHYGIDFIAAALSHFGQLDSAIVFFILAPLAAMAAYLCASMLAAHVLGSIRLGLVAGLFFSFTAGLPFLIEPVKDLYLRWLPPSSAAAQAMLTDSLNSIVPNAFIAFPLYLLLPHFLIAWAILLSVILLSRSLMATGLGPKAILWPLLGALYASVALIEISVFALGLAGWGTFVLWHTARQRDSAWFRCFFLALTPVIILAVFQGGFVTATLRNTLGGGSGLGTSFAFGFVPLPYMFGPPHLHHATEPPWLAVYTLLFGLPLLAAPILLFWLFRSKDPGSLVWIAAIGAIAFVTPHFVIYYFDTMVRWHSFGVTSFSLILGIGALKLSVHMRRRAFALPIFLACAALTVGWPIVTSVKHVTNAPAIVLGQSTEDHWTISPIHRQSDHVDWITGRPNTFQMGAEAREFLRALPASARILTNRFPEVPLLTRGFVPHKNSDLFSFTYFHLPSPTYLDALYALDPTAMADYGITHIVINHFWFVHTTPQTSALLRDPHYFSLLYSDEELHEGFAWHHVYEVLPAFYAETPAATGDLVRSLPGLVPQGASIYVSPAIPADIRWALLYSLREREISSAGSIHNHINVRIDIAEPQPTDRYDFALLIDEPPGDRWLNWEQTPQDLPSAWGLHPSQRIWHLLGVGLYALDRRVCPSPALAGVPPAWHIQANTPTTLDFACLHTDATAASTISVLLTVLSPQPSRINIAAAGGSREFILAPGASLLPLDATNAAEITVTSPDSIWVRAQRVPPNNSDVQAGVPALHILSAFDGRKLNVKLELYGERKNSLENQVVFHLLKQRRIYGHWWHWDSGNSVGTWRLMLDRPPTHGDSFHFALDLETLASTVEAFGEPTSVTTRRPLPASPGEPYVLYVTMFKPGERVLSIPVAWLTYAPGQEPTVLPAPRFILLDQASGQD